MSPVQINDRGDYPDITTSVVNFTPADEFLFISRVATQSIPNNTVTLISFDTETRDDLGWFAPTSTTITAGKACYVEVFAQTLYAQDTLGTGGRKIQLLLNGAVVCGDSDLAPTNVGVFQNLNMVLHVNIGDTIQVDTWQSRGAATNITATLQLYVLRDG